MAVTTKIQYSLPVTRVRLQATVQMVTDTLQDQQDNQKSTTTSFVFSVVTSADPDQRRTLSVEKGLLADYSFQVSLTEDGRLAEAGVGSTGQLGTVLAAGATVAVAAAGVVLGGLPALTGAALAAAGAARAAVRRGGVALGAEIPEPEDPVWGKYRAEHPALAERLQYLLSERDATAQALDQARTALRTAAGDPAARYSRQQEVKILGELLTDLDTDLDKANSQFDTWREGTLTTAIRSYDELLPLNQLPAYKDDGTTDFGAASNVAREFYTATGRMLATVGYDRAVSPAARKSQQDATTALHVLRPRQVVLAHLERADEGSNPHVTGFDRVLVMDAGSEELTIPVRKSLWAKRRTDLSLSELGAITKVSYNNASVAAASQALASVPGKVSSGLEQAEKVNKEIGEIREQPEHPAAKAKPTEQAAEH